MPTAARTRKPRPAAARSSDGQSALFGQTEPVESRSCAAVAEAPSVRVARGAARFDRLRPGWAGRIDLDRLDVQDATGSPESQVFGSVANGCVALFDPQAVGSGWFRGVATADLARLGLCADPGQGNEYGALNEAWRIEVAARLNRKEV